MLANSARRFGVQGTSLFRGLVRSSKEAHGVFGTLTGRFLPADSTRLHSFVRPMCTIESEDSVEASDQGDVAVATSEKLGDGILPEGVRKEVVDAEIIFDTAWRNIMAKVGEEHMVFPKEIIWLAGAPGAGKGTMSRFIMQERDLYHGPIEVSGLLKGPRFDRLKDEGKLVGDRDVVEALLQELLKAKYADGVVVDGFPRTMIQAQCIKLLSDRMRQLRFDYRDHPTLRQNFRRPAFRIVVLYVEEEESVRRQLRRVEEIERANRRAEDTGIGPKLNPRATDLSEKLARERYNIFKNEVYDAIRSIRDSFHFHLIPADRSPEEVGAAISSELIYQSDLELDDDTLELVRRITPASEITRSARQAMIRRLGSYVRDFPSLMTEVLDLLETEFLHILKRQALAGKAIIRSENPILHSAIAINMVLDVLAERGYFVTLDVRNEILPKLVEPAVPGDHSGQPIISETHKSFIFHVEFPRPHIRRGE